MTNAASVPAPTGGWNARDSLDAMDAADAVTMVNLIPRSGWVEARNGYGMFCSLGPASPGNYAESLFASDNGLFVGIGGLIYEVSSGTANLIFSGGSLDITQWQTTNFQDKLIAVCAEYTGGTGPGIVIDDTYAVSDLVVTAPGLSGSFWGCNTFKGRIYYWQKNARSFWYAQAGAFQGTLTEFDLSTQIQSGGTLVMMLTYTLDAGDGVDDLAVFVFSTGETLVYQGDDPGDSLRWSSSGRFQIGAPLGIRAHQKTGGTEIILTGDGYIDLAQALRNGRYSEDSVYSNKIIRAAKDAARNYGDLFGWECILYPAGNLFIVNIPTNPETLRDVGGDPYYSISSYQHVRNTSSGAWCEFQGIDANAFCVFQDKLYFTTSLAVYQADINNTDNGNPINIECIPAFNHLGAKGRRKQVTLAAHLTNFQQPEFLVKDGMSDYNVIYQNQVVEVPFLGGAQWDLVDWDEAYWSNEDAPEIVQTTEGWADVSAFGYAVTVSMRAIINGFSLKWYATNYIYRNAGAI